MTRILSFFTVLALAGVALFAGGTAANATVTTIAIDCNVPLQGGNYFSSGNDLNFTTTNCSGVYQDGSPVSSLTSFTIPFSSLNVYDSNRNFVDLEFFDSNGRIARLKLYKAVNDVTSLNNLTLSSSETITIPAASPQRFDYQYVNGFAGGCSLTQGSHPYQTVTITTTNPGDFTFRISSTSPNTDSNSLALLPSSSQQPPISDTWMAVYSSFDPANPEQGFLGCNEDSGQVGNYLSNGTVLSSLWPQFDVTNLAAGSYTLVLTTYGAPTPSNWSIKTNGVDQTATMQLWGPSGAISAVSNPSATTTNSNSNNSNNSSSNNSNSNNTSSSNPTPSNSNNTQSSASSATPATQVVESSSLALTGVRSGGITSIIFIAGTALIFGAFILYVSRRNRIKGSTHA